MTDGISVKIVEFKLQKVKDEKSYALYEVEPFNYGDHNYSQIEIEYQNESDLKEFVESKSIKIEVGEDMTKGEGNTLVISGGTWNSDRTAWQKIKDTTKGAADKVGDASSGAVKKTGEGLEKASKKLQESADKDKWSRWVLPVVIVVGVLLLIGIIAWIFKPKKK